MNDRLRFRAFHKPTKRMFDVHCFTATEVFENTLDGIGTSPTNPAKMEDCILLQCTGMKDENGKLIYEGDVLFHAYFEKGMVVRFNKLHLYFGMHSVHNPSIWATLFPGVDGVFRIIGNIYQNSELLGEKK
ncbi:YopX family protein [Candidatus Avelusimicrobium fimicolum]|uniref:YopX family protein n=1 Tax=Candidatus Avelusimicrobium fimicolum TaxID=3416216 RepID=UPI003D0CC4A7